MKNFGIFLGVLVILLAFSLVFMACDSGNDDNNNNNTITYDPITYESTHEGSTYRMTITRNPNRAIFNPGAGDLFVLVISGLINGTSSGTIMSFTNNTFSLQASGETIVIVVTASGGMTSITGVIIFQNGTQIEGPGSITQGGDPGNDNPDNNDPGNNNPANNDPGNNNPGNNNPGNDNPGNNNQDSNVFNVTAADFDSTIRSIRNTPGEYIINLTGNLLDYPGIELGTPGVKITIKGNGNNRISWGLKPVSDFFLVNGAHLIFEQINLEYESEFFNELFFLVVRSGTLEIKEGVNIASSNNRGGIAILLQRNGSFIMSGGYIENFTYGIITAGSRQVDPGVTVNGPENMAKGASITINGGIINSNGTGIDMRGEDITLTINSGTISHNTFDGIHIRTAENGYNLTINGGTISHNINGIYTMGVFGSIVMNGGTIRSSTRWGLRIAGASFTKTSNAIIYGSNSGDNSNGHGAISLDVSFSYNNDYTVLDWFDDADGIFVVNTDRDYVTDESTLQPPRADWVE